MLTLAQLLVYGLATYRIASLFVNETGPLHVFRTIREWAGIRHDDAGFPAIIPDNFTAQALSCVWCMSLWVGLFFTIFMFFLPFLSLQIATIFALSTMAILIDRHLGKK